jgi:hypothetical protein
VNTDPIISVLGAKRQHFRPINVLVLLPVSEVEAADDRQWVSEHPRRHHRLRRDRQKVWIIRRWGSVILRIQAIGKARHPADYDLMLQTAWTTAERVGLIPVSLAKAVEELHKVGWRRNPRGDRSQETR